jgi:uncharacterized membrane protein
VKSRKNKKNFDEIVTNWMGSIPSIIIHTVLFCLFLLSPFLGYDLEKSLLVLTTIVSLEAIYLALFIQISINRQSQTIEEVSEDIEEIQEDIEEVSEELEEMSEDIEEIQEDVEDIQEDVEEIQEEDELEETEEQIEEARKKDQKIRLEKIESILEKLLKDISDARK